MIRTYIGIDNGVSGSIGIIKSEDYIPTVRAIIPMPTIRGQNYTKKASDVRRIDRTLLRILLVGYLQYNPLVILERPMINKVRFMQSISAARAHEATICVIEDLGVSLYRNGCIDSRDWQREFLGGITGSEALKAASMAKGKQMFPDIIAEDIEDYDGLFIAEWALRKRL